MLRRILFIVMFVMILGLVGKMECNDLQAMSKIDEQNKQEVIKDLQLRCYTGDLSQEYCRGY